MAPAIRLRQVVAGHRQAGALGHVLALPRYGSDSLDHDEIGQRSLNRQFDNRDQVRMHTDEAIHAA
ncbi:hypothetical protein D3C78_1892930 [compost metagenome]